MRKTIFLFALLFYFLTTKAQENFIINPSFEDMNWCWKCDNVHCIENDYCAFNPELYKLHNSKSGTYKTLQEFSNNTYFLAPQNSLGLYPSSCLGIYFIGDSVRGGLGCDGGGLKPKDGLVDAFISLYYSQYKFEYFNVYRSFLQGTLSSKLKKGCQYRFKAQVYNNEIYQYDDNMATSSIGVAFSSNILNYNKWQDFVINVKPDIENDTNYFFDRVKTDFSGVYTAKGDEQYFTIGNFRTDKNTKLVLLDTTSRKSQGKRGFNSSSYHLDDLSLTAIPPAHLKLNLGKDTITCGKDQPLQLIAQQGFDSYTWNTGDTSRVLNITKAGNYIVKADFGCGVLSDTIVVKAYTYKKNQLQIGEQLQKCPEEQISLKAANGYTNYTWSNGQNGAELSTSTEGIYTLQANSKEGCTVKDTVQIFNITAPQKVYLGKDTVICQGKSIVLDAGTQNTVNFAWNTGSTSQTIEAKEAGNYSVAVSNKCFQVSDTINISTKDCSPIFIPNVFTPNGDGNNDTFKIRTEDNRTVTLDIYNRWGERLYHHASYQNQWNADGILDGMYFYQITDSEYNKTEKGWVQVLR